MEEMTTFDSDCFPSLGPLSIASSLYPDFAGNINFIFYTCCKIVQN